MAGGPSSKKSSKKRRARRRRTWNRNPAAELPDDLLLEILARVPYSSLCRFRCVSKRWSALISDPKNRERLPQTLAGFFYRMPSGGSTPHSYGFLNVSGTGAPFIEPSFSFLPDSEREGLELVDCCNGFKSVFLDGVLYVIAVECVIGAVDVDGRTWRVIKFPRRKDFSSLFDTAAAAGFIDLSQGQLHFVKAGLAVWVLENKDSKKWTLKETGRFKHLVRTKNVVAIHPDRNMVFFVFGCERTLKSYDMDSRKECIICNLGSWIQ
ncbi:unnamed protein product [Urochloa decumbens]|uniref:F-box domain-containing protein n=1 Tax=Urochloa decumbens TaxID=240449 RepID=A0ABC9GGH3_9POAL